MRLRLRVGGLLLGLSPVVSLCQPVVTPTPRSAGSAAGQSLGEYNVTNSWEAGYRIHSVDGNRGKYRSDVNFGNGVRLFGGTLGMHSRNGRGRWFDELTADLRGLAGDPYSFASVRAKKNQVYSYEMVYRGSEYFNPAQVLSDGNQFLGTTRRLQDHDLTLAPRSAVRVRAGFTANRQSGEGYSTGQWFDARGDTFAFLTGVRRAQTEARVGADVVLRRFRLSVTRAWEFFKDDTRFAMPLDGVGANPDDRTTLEALRRDEPVRGRTPSWRGTLHWEPVRWLIAQGRGTHAAGERDFLYDEAARGTDRFGADRNRQILLSGSGRRVVSSGSGTVTLRPAEAWNLSHQFAFHQTRMEGDARYAEWSNGSQGLALASFQNLGIRLVSNASEVAWQPRKWVALYGNFQVSERQVRSRELLETALPATAPFVTQTNRQKAGAGGVRLQPAKGWRIFAEAETGKNDRPFYPTSDKDYTAQHARVSYRGGGVFLEGQFRRFTNTNSASLFLHSATGRDWAFQGGWSPAGAVQFDAGYSHIHRNTLTGLAYFANFTLQAADRSYYLSNIGAAHASATVRMGKRADLWVSYNWTEDRARSGAAGAAALTVPETASFFAGAQVFPFSWQSPMARFSVVLRPNLRWNAGWQSYRYRERVAASQDYNAHTGYTSLSYSF